MSSYFRTAHGEKSDDGFCQETITNNTSHLIANVVNCSRFLIGPMKKYHWHLSLLILLFLLGMKEGLSQPLFQEEKEPQIRLRNVAFQIRDIESDSLPLKMLEVHIEIFNRSQRLAAPRNSIKVAVVPKEIKYKDTNVVAEMALFPEEATLNAALPPRTGRVMTIGFSMPEEKLESITFEIQINPPEGEKKTVTWTGG